MAGGKAKGSSENCGLGKALIRNKKAARRTSRQGDQSILRHGTESADGPSWANLQSVTQEGDLQEFVSLAQLAGTDFTAERHNVQVIALNQPLGFLPSREEQRATRAQHCVLADQLRIPRRPEWNASTTPAELHERERTSFLEWRRGLAELEESQGMLLTPFERNLEVWRQLWRVVERSDLVVQIVDARNPLFFRCPDLERYVDKSLGPGRNMLLINKADYLTAAQRAAWAAYFNSCGIRFSFFSALRALDSEGEAPVGAVAANYDYDTEDEEEDHFSTGEENNDNDGDDDHNDDDDGDNYDNVSGTGKISGIIRNENMHISGHQEKGNEKEFEGNGTRGHGSRSNDFGLDTHILDTEELLEIFRHSCSDGPRRPDARNPLRITVGLVGYPNVGKSSTINALLSADVRQAGEDGGNTKRVSVSATPGKTKHFQTLLLRDLMLCDCPGLVFPSFASTRAEMVCSGVLPIDQLRNSAAPTSLVAQRIPRALLDAEYTIKIEVVDDATDDPEAVRKLPTGPELCRAYAFSRGFMRASHGDADESRAARYILKDYVNGRLLYVHPPPRTVSSDNAQDDDEEEEECARFNQELYSRMVARIERRKKEAVVLAPASSPAGKAANSAPLVHHGVTPRGEELDDGFFAGKAGRRAGFIAMDPFRASTVVGCGRKHGRRRKPVRAVILGDDSTNATIR